MKTREEYLEILRRVKAGADERLGLRSIGIFVSVARGDNRPDSDLDVFVDVANPSYGRLDALRAQLRAVCGCEVDLVHVHRWLGVPFLNTLKEDGIYA